MKNLIMSLCIFASVHAYSQKITFADSDLKGKYELNIKGKSDSRIFVYQHSLGDFGTNECTEYDFDLKATPSEKYKRSGSYFANPDLFPPFIYDGKVSFIYQGYEQKTYYLRVIQPFDGNKFIDLDTSKSAFVGMTRNDYKAILSDDSTCFVIAQLLKRKKEPVDLKYYVIDNNYKVISKKASIKIPAADEKSAQDVDLYQYGKYFVARIMIKGKSDRILGFKYIISNSVDNTTKEVELPQLPDAAYTSYSAYMSNPDEVIIKGFYNEWTDAKKADKKSVAKGVYAYTLNLKEGKLASDIKTEVNEKGQAALESIRSDKGSEQFLSDFIRMSDGTSLIMADCVTPSSTSSHAHTSTSPGGSFSSTQWSSSTSTAKYFNLYVLSFDAKGNFQWYKKIDRREKDIAHAGGQRRTGFGSYGLLEGKSSIHLFCNDDDKVVDHIVTATGEITSKTVDFLNPKDDVVIFPDEALMLSETEIVFPCLKNKRSTLVKLEY